MRSWKFLFLLLAPTLCLAAQTDRVAGAVDPGQMVQLQGNMHDLARTEFDQGRADGSRMLSAVSLVFKPSAAQQSALDQLLAQQENASSPNYHKWLTPAQFGNRFGMSQNDIDKVVSWLQSQGLTVTRIANGRNQIFFAGTVAQIEAAFRVEIHNYLVDGELHYANAAEPSIPAALVGVALAVRNLNNFQPKPRAMVRKIAAGGANPNFTSHISGDHFVTPGDFTTLYDLQPIYTGGADGTGQKIALTGQSSIALTDAANFRSAAGLAAKAPSLLLIGGTSTRCAGDEGESDLDVEWSGAVAKNASITLVYAGLESGDTCTNRQLGAFDALQYAIDHNVAPVISNSYGNCESAVGLSFAQTMQGWIQQANTQGQTVISASGDSGAADCDYQVTSATQGLAVDMPASIPEVTGMGGTEFTGDPAATVTSGNAAATTYWSGTTGGTDTISSALSYIPETSWNDTTNADNTGGDILASGGGASIFFSKPSWQTGTGVPGDGKRDVPDLALNASPDHDPYLFCSEDGANGTVVASCTSGFRTGSGGDLTAVGGTSAAAPTFAGIVALISEQLGSSGLGNINPTLYGLAASNPSAFHDVTTGNNIVPCTSGSTGCPAGGKYGFSAGTGYDQVTGLGSVDANALAVAWAASLKPDFQLSPSPAALTVAAGQAVSATLTISAITGSTAMVVNFSPSGCSGLPAGVTCNFNPASVNFDGTDPVTTTVTFSTAANMALPTAAQTITITPVNSASTSASFGLTVTKTTETFTISSTAATFPIGVGGTAQIPITVNSTTGFLTTNGTTALPLTYSCSGIPATAEISCQVSNNNQPTTASTVTVSLVTTPVTTQLAPSPFGRSRIFYAMLLPGLFGVVFVRPRARSLRLLTLIAVLGFSTLWMSACGGSSNSNNSLRNAGTPPGNYVVTINATTGGAVPIADSNAPFTVTLAVGAQ